MIIFWFLAMLISSFLSIFSGDLTDGQSAQLSKNEAGIEHWTNRVSDAVDAIRLRQATKARKGTKLAAMKGGGGSKKKVETAAARRRRRRRELEDDGNEIFSYIV